MKSVILYGKNGCPKCFYCETKLKAKDNIDLCVIHDEKKAEEIAGAYWLTEELPIIIENGQAHQGVDAVEWVKGICS